MTKHEFFYSGVTDEKSSIADIMFTDLLPKPLGIKSRIRQQSELAGNQQHSIT